MEKIKAPRESNFELLRIVSMLLIIGLHYYNLGVIIPDDAAATFNNYFIRFVGFGGRVGVDMFVLISGYFLVDQKFKAKKAFQICLQCGVLTALPALIYVLRGSLGWRAILNSLLCVPYNGQWFVTTYFVMYLLIDYLNIIVRSVSRKQLLALVLTLLAVCSILPTFFGMRMISSALFLFITLYFIAAYIKVYSPKIFESKYILLIGVGFHWLCYAVSMVCFSLRELSPRLLQISDRMSARDDLTVIIAAVLIFAGFRNLKIGHSKLINALGASAFGVYLLHMNQYTQHDQWVNILKTPHVYETPYMIIHAPLCLIGLFLFYAPIDMLYRRFIQTPIMKLWDICAARVKSSVPKLCRKSKAGD